MLPVHHYIDIHCGATIKQQKKTHEQHAYTLLINIYMTLHVEVCIHFIYLPSIFWASSKDVQTDYNRLFFFVFFLTSVYFFDDFLDRCVRLLHKPVTTGFCDFAIAGINTNL